MKSIMISIKPKYVADILNGRKTIEIRKTMPKCDLPIDVYIYCSKDLKSGKKVLTWLNEKGLSKVKTITYLGNDILGKVVAKFTLNKAEELPFSKRQKQWANNELVFGCQLTYTEFCDYLQYKTGYAWYISNLVIFDEPKELSEFYHFIKSIDWCLVPLEKAPQNMCYVEVSE